MKKLTAPFDPKKYPYVISNGKVMEYVGIGYIDIRDATPEDYSKLNEVTR